MSEEENKNQEEDNKELNKDTVNEEVQSDSEVKVEPTIEDRYNELNDKYIRIHAEFDNYRKRTNKEKIDVITNANEDILKDLLPVIDDFDRAIENNLTSEDLNGVKEGFNLIYNKFSSILESKGLKKMNCKGDVFDVEIHEAVANIPAKNKKQKGKVVEAVEKGYYLNDKVIRFAKVVVGQ